MIIFKNTVFVKYLFGVISSPFLLGATVKNHPISNTCEIADNVISGTEIVEDAMQFRTMHSLPSKMDH